MMSFRTVIDTKPLTSYSKEVRDKLPTIVKKNALELESKTKTSQDMPIDTGALRDSIQASEDTDALHWKVDDGMEYGVFQELGTSRGIVAKHFLGGACEEQADEFFDEVKEALK